MTAPAISTSAPRLPTAVLAAAVIWFGLVLIAGGVGFFTSLPFPGAQLIILGLFVAALAAGITVPTLRAWIDARPLRALIGINALRFVGIWFLVLAARGQLAQVFANRAGWGDIAVAALAIALSITGEPRTAPQRAVVHVWNAFGLLDLVVAVATATMVTVQGVTPGVQPLLSFPLVAVPAFFVPLFLANHVFIFRRLIAAGRAAGGR
jgi:hypothetical protein